MLMEGERAERQGLQEGMVVELEREREGQCDIVECRCCSAGWEEGAGGVFEGWEGGGGVSSGGEGTGWGTLGRIEQVCIEGKNEREEVYVRGRQGHSCEKSGKELAVVG